MAIYYIDPLGTDDASHGTSPGAGAWKSVEYAMERGGLAHGDTVNMAAGNITSFYDGTTINLVVTGDAATPLVFQGQGDSTVIDLPATLGAWWVRNALGANLAFKDFKFANSNALSSKYILLQNRSVSDKLLFERVNFSEIGNNTPVSTSSFRTTVNFVDCNLYGLTAANVVGLDSNGVDVSISGGVIGDCKSVFATSSPIKMTISDTILAKFSQPIFAFNATSSAGYEIDVHDCIICVGGSGGSDIAMYMTAHSGAYFRDNPTKFKFNRNRVWTLDDRSTWTADTYNKIINPDGANPLLDADNWFADPGITEAHIVARTVDTESAYFGQPSVSLNPSSIGLFGDSIMYGEVATEGSKGFQVLAAMLPYVNVADNDNVSIPALETCGAYWLLDIAHTQTAPKYLAMAIGVNDFVDTSGALESHRSAAELAEDIQVIMQKHEAAGGVCMWLGIEPVKDGADLTTIEAVNSAMEAYCDSNGIRHRNILASMQVNVSWKVVYYDALATNLHPNNAGHLLIAQLAEAAFTAERYGIEYGLWTTCDSSLPTEGQLFKSHAIPISAKKLTVFPGVATNAQISEAQ